MIEAGGVGSGRDDRSFASRPARGGRRGRSRSGRAGGEAPAIEIEGGPFSGVIYGVEELVQKQLADDAAVEAGTVEQAPGLAYRTFWNWDHTTNWELTQIGVQEIGVMNPYTSRPTASWPISSASSTS